MINLNKKRYVYLDKYIDFQEKMNSKLERINKRINLLTFVVMGIIVAASVTLIEIFG